MGAIIGYLKSGYAQLPECKAVLSKTAEAISYIRSDAGALSKWCSLTASVLTLRNKEVYETAISKLKSFGDMADCFGVFAAARDLVVFGKDFWATRTIDLESGKTASFAVAGLSEAALAAHDFELVDLDKWTLKALTGLNSPVAVSLGTVATVLGTVGSTIASVLTYREIKAISYRRCKVNGANSYGFLIEKNAFHKALPKVLSLVSKVTSIWLTVIKPLGFKPAEKTLVIASMFAKATGLASFLLTEFAKQAAKPEGVR